MKLTTIILLFITIILILFGFVFKKSKLLFMLQALFMWVLVAFNTDSADYLVHLNIFNSAQNNIKLISNEGGGYLLLCYLFKNNNMSFEFMNIILNTVALIILFVIVFKLTDKICFVTSLFLIFPYINYIIQKRYFLSSVFIVLCFYFEFKKTKKSKLISILLCIVAAQIHVTAYIYLIYIILFRLSEERLKKIIPIIIIISIILIPILPKLALFIFPASKVELYFIKLKLGYEDALFWTLFHVFFVYLLNRLYKKVETKNDSLIKDVFKLNLISLAFISLYYYEPTFFRFFRTILIFNYICFANVQIDGYVIRKKTFGLTVMQICYVIFATIVVNVIASKGVEYIVMPIYESNSIINYIFK